MSEQIDVTKAERRLGERHQVKPDRWYAYVATPAYDGKVYVDYCQSMAEAAFCCPLYQVGLTACCTSNGAFIELARNVYVKMFLSDENKEATHLFFIDADLKFPPNAFIGLMRSGMPICAGVYRRREEEETYPCAWSANPNGAGLWVEDEWLMCDRVPTGFLCISRQVIQEMAEEAPKIIVHGMEEPVPWLFGTKFDEKNRFVGEDFTFCDKYREKYKKPIPVWPDIDFVHAGYKCNYHAWINKKVEELEKEAQTSSAA